MSATIAYTIGALDSALLPVHTVAPSPSKTIYINKEKRHWELTSYSSYRVIYLQDILDILCL